MEPADSQSSSLTDKPDTGAPTFAPASLVWMEGTVRQNVPTETSRRWHSHEIVSLKVLSYMHCVSPTPKQSAPVPEVA